MKTVAWSVYAAGDLVVGYKTSCSGKVSHNPGSNDECVVLGTRQICLNAAMFKVVMVCLWDQNYII
jgi:hypothetical protein